MFRETCGAVGFYALLLFETASGPDKLTRLHSHFCVRVVHCSCHSDPSSHRTITLSPVMDTIWTTLRSSGHCLCLLRTAYRLETHANEIPVLPQPLDVVTAFGAEWSFAGRLLLEPWLGRQQLCSAANGPDRNHQIHSLRRVCAPEHWWQTQ